MLHCQPFAHQKSLCIYLYSTQTQSNPHCTLFLVQEHALGCILTLSSTAKQSLPVTCYLIHQHTHNPHTSRLWEHGLYAMNGPQEGVCMLGIASEGDVFVHGARAADGRALDFGQMGYVCTLEDAATWAHEVPVARP